VKSRVFLAFASLTAIWGASFLWIKIAVLDIGPFSLVGWRLLFAVAGLLAVLAARRPERPRGARTWTAIAVVGVLTTALPWLCIAWAEQTLDSALATVLNSTVPMFTVLLGHFALHDERMTIRRVGGVALGFVGVVILTRSGQADGASGGSHAPAVLAMLISSLCYALGTIVARRYLRHLSSLAQAFYSIIAGTVIVWACFPLIDGGVRVPTRPMVWVAIAWLGVLGAGIGGYVFFFLLDRVGPTRASLITYLIPPIGVALGVVVLGERLDAFLVGGAVLIVAGLWVVNRKWTVHGDE
jgi:drug/metabolite transporter (DMT)-like permease